MYAATHVHRAWYEEGPIKWPGLLELGEVQLSELALFDSPLALYILSDLMRIESNRVDSIARGP